MSVANEDAALPGRLDGVGGRLSPGRPARDAALLLAGVLATALVTIGVLRASGPILVALAVLALAVVVTLGRRWLTALRVGRLLRGLVILIPVAAIFGPALALPGFPQLFAFRVLVGLVAFAGLTWLLATRAGVRLAGRPFFLLLACWLGWEALTLLWAPYKQAGFTHFSESVLMVALVLATAFAGTARRRLEALCWLLAFAFAAITLTTVAEAQLGIRLPTSRLLNITSRGGVTAVTSVFYNQNDLATYLAISWPFLLITFFLTQRRLWRALSVLGMALLLFALLHTGSRTSVLAIGISTVGCAVYFGRGGAFSTRRAKKIGIVLVLALVAGAGFLLFNTSSNAILSQFQLSTLVAQVRTQQGSGEIRTNLQERGLAMAAGSYLLGVGPGNAESILGSGLDPSPVVNLHDWWLELLANGGLPGLLLQVALYLSLIAAMSTIARRARDLLVRYLAIALLLALLGFSIGALGPSTVSTFTPMWIMYGLAIAVVSLHTRQTATTKPL